jgi:hypothetical protein
MAGLNMEPPPPGPTTLNSRARAVWLAIWLTMQNAIAHSAKIAAYFFTGLRPSYDFAAYHHIAVGILRQHNCICDKYLCFALPFAANVWA